MKRCTYCGKEYPDDVPVCPVDQEPLRQTTPPSLPLPNPGSQTAQFPKGSADVDHLTALSVCHFVLAGLTSVGLAFLFIHYLLFANILSHPEYWHTRQNPVSPQPLYAFKYFMEIFYLGFGSVIFASMVLNILSGLFIRRRKHRMFSFAVAVINCMHFPFGTTLGIFTLIVLLRESVRQLYDRAASIAR